MRPFIFLSLLAIVAAPPRSQAAPVPKRTNAKPAVIDAGNEKNIPGACEYLVNWARVAVRENKEVSSLPVVRSQGKDWEAWLKQNLRVVRVKDTNLVHVSFRDGNAKDQVAIINVVVDYYLKNDVGVAREQSTQLIKRMNGMIEAKRRRGRFKPEEVASLEEKIKKSEEYIRVLPALVEHAKVP